MSQVHSWDEIEIFDDHVDDLEIMKKMINESHVEECFHVFDVAVVIRKYKAWIKRLPRVVPHYAIKCNPHPVVIKALAALGASFDCAARDEIKMVMDHGVPAEKIIFANPVKIHNHIRYSKKMGVDKMTVDNLSELDKIKDIYPEAKILIRFRVRDAGSKVDLGKKCGCDPGEEAPQMIYRCRELGLDLYGFSFHVGSLCGDPAAVGRGIRICRLLIDAATHIGLKIRMIDIGGGFPGGHESRLDEFVGIIDEALKEIDPAIKVISEPGRYFVTAAGHAAVRVSGKKVIMDGTTKKMMYYLNDGVFSSFYAHFLEVEKTLPHRLFKGKNGDEKFLSVLWGQTTETLDCIIKNVYLPEYEEGEWLYWTEMGGYTRAFTKIIVEGYPDPLKIPFMRKSKWEAFMTELREIKEQNMKRQVSDKFPKDMYFKSDVFINKLELSVVDQ